MAKAAKAYKVQVNALLHVVKDTLAATVRSDSADLSGRQMSALLKVYLEPTVERTARGLAADLNISKPAITRALDRLEELIFAKSEEDTRDRRSVIVRGTAGGASNLGTLSGYLNAASKAAANAVER